jgi:hypothetical protein
MNVSVDLAPTIRAFRPFLPVKDFKTSLRFYEAMGFEYYPLGEVPGSEPAHHLRQWSAVHCSRLQGVHSHLGHDTCPKLAELPAVQREAGTLAQDAEARVHSTGNAAVTGRCKTPDPTVMWIATTMSACTTPSATWRQTICSRGGRSRFTLSATAS